MKTLLTQVRRICRMNRMYWGGNDMGVGALIPNGKGVKLKEKEDEFNEEKILELVNLCTRLNDSELVVVAVSAICEFTFRSGKEVDEVMNIIYDTHTDYVKQLQTKVDPFENALNVLSKEDLTIDDILDACGNI